ncbi:MAG: hypothetical protein IT465_04820 [Moraxellaceae bacterium]|nr:hypothetical protein [Moraxellaceae bacterium]
MSIYSKAFIAIEESYPDAKWLNFYHHVDDSYRQWFLKEGDLKRPSLLECQAALHTYLPKLVPMWQHLIQLTQADDMLVRLVSCYCPTPTLSGCSQAVWTRYNPVLIRNYDYSPYLCEGRILKSNWHGTSVIASTDCLWGALDGMNEHGLSVSIAFGGSDVVGEGFGIALIVRYILEFCKNTLEAVQVLRHVPVNMAFNVTLLDAYNDVATVEISPIEPAKVSALPLAVNHQGDFDLSHYALFSHSYERKQILLEGLYEPQMNVGSFTDSFEYAPLFSTDYANAFGTLYTAIYNPLFRAMEYRWPYHVRMYQSFEVFIEQTLWVSY